MALTMLTLPTEVRSMIFQLVIIRHIDYYFPRYYRMDNPNVELLVICRQLYQENLPLLPTKLDLYLWGTHLNTLSHFVSQVSRINSWTSDNLLDRVGSIEVRVPRLSFNSITGGIYLKDPLGQAPARDLAQQLRRWGSDPSLVRYMMFHGIYEPSMPLLPVGDMKTIMLEIPRDGEGGGTR
ncbi:uncharacterized protein AB675_603 [Cyphellophora attinorum]|uniref:F-box domain-containing protein n=1 Tax=Cyphellophora attinorum TaxID=1664694 RepID=A0A0N1P2J2_9EURO|nr:uncharacterized protein AB675_603 [Phialophora attinorum]KPI45640.1 hypothetical protein AB675_603 [Phialophora attinorum]